MRIGHGYDVHRLVSGRPCIIGGVNIPFELGLDGHSDADVLTHAVMDSLLGALALFVKRKTFDFARDRKTPVRLRVVFQQNAQKTQVKL